MSPNILVCSIFVSSYILNNLYKQISSYTNKRVKMSVFELEMILLPDNWKSSHWFLACVVNPGCIFNKSCDEKDEEHPW